MVCDELVFEFNPRPFHQVENHVPALVRDSPGVCCRLKDEVTVPAITGMKMTREAVIESVIIGNVKEVSVCEIGDRRRDVVRENDHDTIGRDHRVGEEHFVIVCWLLNPHGVVS
jgi:hypothetical protein